jgi:hypothetical protein
LSAIHPEHAPRIVQCLAFHGMASECIAQKQDFS